jgi:hypothetical protein
MRTLVLALAVSAGLAAVPQPGAAQYRNRYPPTLEDVRQARRQEELARLRRQRIEREYELARRQREIERQRIENRDRRLDDVLRDRDRDVILVRNGQQGKNGNGPPFCRNGQGHPVHGRQWCRDKGWGLGDGRVVRRDDDVIWGSDRYPDRYPDRDGRASGGGVLDRIGDIMRGRTR